MIFTNMCAIPLSFMSADILKTIVRDTYILIMFLRFAARDAMSIRDRAVEWPTRIDTGKVACIRYGREIMRLTFIGQLAAPRSRSLNYSPVLPETS